MLIPINIEYICIIDYNLSETLLRKEMPREISLFCIKKIDLTNCFIPFQLIINYFTNLKQLLSSVPKLRMS